MGKKQKKQGAANGAAPSYAFRRGSRVGGVDAAEVAAELDRLRRLHKGVTPEHVVQAASDPDSAMHDAFEWDDSVAAQQHRLWQARALIRAVVVIYPKTAPQSVYVHVRTEDSNSYQPMTVVAKSPDMFAAACEELTEKIAMARRSLAELQNFAQHKPAVAKPLKTVGGHLAAAEQAAKGIR